MMGKRPLEGAKSFLKRRTIPTIREGIEAGLTPVTDDPVGLTLLKLNEMRRFTEGHREFADLKAAGLVHYVRTGEGAPAGYRPLNDKIAKAFGPPFAEATESYDPYLRAGLLKVLTDLGGTFKRPVRIKGGSLGVAGTPPLGGEGPSTVQARFGTDVTVLEHELGHVLDSRYGLWDALVKPAPQETFTVTRGPRQGQTVRRSAQQMASIVAERKQVKTELRALADLRFEGQANVSDYYKSYVRQKPEQMANAVHALIYAPERFAQVAPLLKSRLEALLAAHPETAPLLHLKKSLVAATGTAQIPLGGFPQVGQWYVPEPVARIFDNYLSPGLRGNALYDAYQVVGNGLNQAQLGLSAFHLGFTSLDAGVSKLALGLEQVKSGQLGKGAGSIAQASTILGPAITGVRRGAKLRAAYLSEKPTGELGQMVDALVQAGGRVRMDEFYRTRALDALKGAWRRRSPGGVLGYALPALLDAAARPVLEYVVPRQKLGVFYDLARHQLSTMKDAGPAEVRAALGKVWDSVDNRMGQMVYDNLFWDRTLKDALMASVRSVGWNLGTVREIGGGAADIAKGQFSHRAAYVIALPAFAALAGSAVQYLYTGQGPRDFKDAFYPRTGRVNENGNEERLTLPTYMKDIDAYSRHPWETLQHKAQPLIALVAEMLNNKDFYGDMIYNKRDTWPQIAAQIGKYLGKSVIPFGIRNALQESAQRQSDVTRGAPFVGLVPAPREVVRSKAQNLMHELALESGTPTRTPEQQAQRERTRAAEQGYRLGEVSRTALRDSLATGALTVGQFRRTVKERQEPQFVSQFRGLPWEQAEQVYAQGTPEERAAWAVLLQHKRLLALKQLRLAGVNDQRTEELVARIRGAQAVAR